MARKGLNATFSYSTGKNAPLRAFRVRIDTVTHGTQFSAEESQARTVKAYYPHRRYDDQFTVNVICNGYSERKAFTNYLDRYASFALAPNLAVGTFPPMLISVPSRGFVRKGVPLTGFDYGDHVGSMIFNHSVTFEPVPSQVSVNDASRPIYIEAMKDPNTEFFYPFTRQLSGNQVPEFYSLVSQTMEQQQRDILARDRNNERMDQ